jgi:membrane-associated phospholipid phosphatase
VRLTFVQCERTVIHVSAVGHAGRYEEYEDLSRVAGRIRTIGSHVAEEFPPPVPYATDHRGTTASWLSAALVLLLAGFGLAVAAAGDGVVPGDINIARAIQRPASAEIDAVARLASLVGDDFPAMVVLALIGVGTLIYLGRRDLALFLGFAAALRAVGPGLKVIVNSPRPSIEAVAVMAQADGPGYPSGHAMGAALFYSAIAIVIPQVIANRLVARGIQVAAFAMMGLIALSRVRLGVHWPSDVIGGLLFGLAAVCVIQATLLAWRQDRIKR